MKFGQVGNPEGIDFAIPADDDCMNGICGKAKTREMKVHVGRAKWTKMDLANFTLRERRVNSGITRRSSIRSS